MTRNRAGWVILATAFVVLFFGGGSRHVFGLLLVPMSDDLNWSRTTLSLAPTVFFWVSAAAMPFTGRLADRYSLRWLMAGGGLAAALGIGLMARVSEPWQAFLLYGVVYALGSAFFGTGTIGVLVTRWFPDRRGLANGIALSGNAIGQLVIITALSSMLVDIGWEWSFGLVAIAMASVAVPLSAAAIRSAPVRGVLDEIKSGAPGTGPTPALVSSTVGEVVTSGQFWILVVIFTCCGFSDFLVATHIVAFSTDQGMGQVLAGNILALMGLLSLIGVLSSGAMADRWGAARPTMLCFLMRIVLFSLILASQNTATIVVFALLYGFTFMITAPLVVVFVGNIFGSARLGAVSGIVSMVHQVSGGTGTLVGAVIFDRLGSYDWAWVVLLGMAVLAAGFTAIVRERPLASARAEATV